MIGWRGHIGKLSPAPIAGRFVREFYEVVPDGVDITCSDLSVQTISKDSMSDMMSRVSAGTALIAEKGVDAIYLGGIPPIVMKHPGYDLEVVAEMERIGGKPACTDMTAVMEALRSLGAQRIAMAAPFEDWVNELIKKYVAAAGFEVVHVKGPKLVTSTQRRALPLEVEYRFAREVCLEAPKEVDVIWVPCGGWGTVYNVPRLEDDLGKPVVTWFNTFIWWFLTKMSIREPITEFGMLLKSVSDARPIRSRD